MDTNGQIAWLLKSIKCMLQEGGDVAARDIKGLAQIAAGLPLNRPEIKQELEKCSYEKNIEQKNKELLRIIEEFEKQFELIQEQDLKEKNGADSTDEEPDEINDPEFVTAFINETGGYIDNIETCLFKLKENLSDAESINSIFRSFHTIKGLALFLNLNEIFFLAREIEAFLADAREGRIKLTGDIIRALFICLDAMKEMREKVMNTQGKCSLMNMDHLRLLVAGLKGDNAGNSGQKTQEKNTGARATDEIIRVSSGRLDGIIALAEQSLTAVNDCLGDETMQAHIDDRLTSKVDAMTKTIETLYKESLLLRLVPIKGIFNRAERMADDVAKNCGKNIDFSFIGGETEIDRNAGEAIFEMLMHMLRNAVDHGIEANAEERQKNGKNAGGKICVSARLDMGKIIIEVGDDGRGLDRELILEKAAQKGILIKDFNKQDINLVYSLIFIPGFSTAKSAGDISGRGVGMDVVKKNVEKLNGQIKVLSETGKGTSFIIHLPLITSLIEAVEVESEGENYYIPVSDIYRIVPKKAGPEECMELSELTGIKLQANGKRALYCIFWGKNQNEAVIVDDVEGRGRILVKPPSMTLETPEWVEGYTITRQGEVKSILRLQKLTEHFRLKAVISR